MHHPQSNPYSGPVDYLVPGSDVRRGAKNFPYELAQVLADIKEKRAEEFLIGESARGQAEDRTTWHTLLVEDPSWIRGRLARPEDKKDHEMASSILATRPELNQWALPQKYNRPSPLPSAASPLELGEEEKAWWFEQLQGGAVRVTVNRERDLDYIFETNARCLLGQDRQVAFQVATQDSKVPFMARAGMNLTDWVHSEEDINGAVIRANVNGGVSGARGRRFLTLDTARMATSTGTIPPRPDQRFYLQESGGGYTFSTQMP